MAELHWVGGASISQQVDEIVLGGTWANGETVTFTITNENNDAITVVTTLVSPADVEDARDQVLAKLQADTQSEFEEITFSDSSTDTILCTANDPGVPFALAVTESSSSGTITDNDGGTGNSVASSGPNDVAVVANYEDNAGSPAGAIPTTGDELFADEGDYDMKYSLPQGVALNRLVRGPNYHGEMGDPDRGYPLRYSTNSGADQKCVLDGRGGRTWLHGTIPNAVIRGVKSADSKAMRVTGDVDTARVTGGACRGTLIFGAAMTLDNVHVAGTGPGFLLDVQENISSLDLVEQNSGGSQIKTNPVTLKLSGVGTNAKVTGTEDMTAYENRGAHMDYQGSGDCTDSDQWGGFTTLRPNQPCDWGTIRNHWGKFTDEQSPVTISYTAATRYGGEVSLTGIAVATE